MSRLIAIAVVLVAVAAAFLLVRGGGEEMPEYEVIFDNSFGLTEDADVRAAGVVVGSVSGLDVERGTGRAIVKVKLNRTDFGDFRKDIRCNVQPQSLIGEYFMDCEPGQGERLRNGARVPVEQTSGTVPPDLVQNVMRRPRREKLGIILAELGAGFATRGEDLAAIIRRSVPALEETNRVLKILADERETITSLTREADTVIGALAGNKEDVARFVAEARDTATASAERRDDLAENIRLLPRFLREFRPTLRKLGRAADEQTPALRDLRASAGDLTTLFNRLGPFTQASRPAINSLGRTGVTGRRAIRDVRPLIDRLRQLGAASPEPLTNLAMVLEDLNDRDRAVEPNPLSAGGRGYTGLEAFLLFPHLQAHAINTFDSRGYILKLNALINECSQYTDAKTAREEAGRTRRCTQALGPNQPGINQPDPAPDSSEPSQPSQPDVGSPPRSQPRSSAGARQASGSGAAKNEPRGAAPGDDGRGGMVGKVLDQLEKPVRVPGGKAPSAAAPKPAAPAQGGADSSSGLLDFLLAP
jgi:virulence factor Mce-like protein